ncbi:hypothetical protein FOZ62_000652 [Perkinsus olseni]|uniref:Uncharacterized protein n=2 Tax=Perkinsus olseni TaxID=32597 RepID=A0A7J6PVY8_PEROL|nr:hypothetical protein FOZ62_000652 [Perkinsus olseni]
MPQIRKHLAGVEGKVSIILCPNAGEMLITVHLEKGVAETVPEGSLQAAVQSSSAELKRVVVDVIVNGKRSRLASTTSEAGCNGTLSRSGDELCHGRSSERDSRRSRKIRDAFVTEYYHVDNLQPDIRLRFKDGFKAVANPAVERQKLNWMVRTAIKCLSLLPVRGRRKLLEIPCGTSLYTVALGSLFDDSVCVVEGHKGKVAAAWGKLRLNSLEGKVKIVRGCPSSKIGVLREHEFDMAVVAVETSGIGDEVRSYLSTVPCIMYISEYSAAVRRDIRLLSISHRVVDLGLFDFLPFDESIECCVVMLRRDVV